AVYFFFQAEDGIRDYKVTGVQTCALPIYADQAEAVTPPAQLARSQLAAGLDLLFVSDHDSTVNLAVLQQIAGARGVAFIPGIERSEERRVGKEGRNWGGGEQEKENSREQR